MNGIINDKAVKNGQGKIDVRVVRTYGALFQALVELLLEKSFDDITVLEICNEANIHRATFYKHFVDKYDFLNKCIRLKLSQLTLGKPEDSYTAASLKKSSMSMFVKVLDFIELNRSLLTNVTSVEYSSYFSLALIDAVSEFFEERLHVVKPDAFNLEKQIPMLANYYAGAVVGLIKWWMGNEIGCSKQDLLDFIEIKINDLCNYFDRFCA